MSKVAYIDDQPYAFESGQTILEYVRQHIGDDAVPTLCDVPGVLKPFGSCRVCSVDVAIGMGSGVNATMRTVASCHTPITENLHVYLATKRIERLRRNIIELVLTDHPLECLTCEANGNCELQDVAAKVGIREVRYPAGSNHLHYDKDASDPYMRSDLSKCINCYRCVRACDEIQGQFVLSMAGRGFDSRVIKGKDVSFDQSDCVSCGACAQACPTSAISDVFQSKSVVADRTTRTVCSYCGVGCNLEVATRSGEVVSIRSPYDARANGGHTCVKGRYAFGFYNHPDRLRSPMIRRDGRLVEVSWDEAYDFIVAKLSAIKKSHGPDAIGGISSSRCTNEENYLMQKFMRAVVGTNNIDGCARVCHSPTALGMQRAFGMGAATNSIDDLDHTDCILIVGANPTIAHPVTGARIKQQAIAGKSLIVIDPRRTEVAKFAQYHLQLRPGTNVAVLNMMMHAIVKEDLHDKAFLAERTEGWAEFEQQILRVDIDRLESVSGVDRELVCQAAIAYATADRAMSFHGLGVTEHYQGTYAVMLIADLAMLTGNIGRPGVGVNPLRGQNNVQGAADMGVQPHQGAGYLDVTDAEVRQRYEKHYGVPVPGEVGYKIPEMFDAALTGQLKALWIIGEDPAQTDPNSHKVTRALESLDLLVVQELFMTETAKFADVILPGTSFLEKNGTFTNGERRVQRVQAAVDPIKGTKVDGQIIVDMINRMGYRQADYNAAAVLEEISRIVPFFQGITWENLGDHGLQWPVGEDGVDTKTLHTERFIRPGGKGRLHYVGFQETPEIEDHQQQYPLILTTNRELAHYNCGAMTRRTGNVLILGEDELLVNSKDAGKYNVADGDKVLVVSARGQVTLTARVSDEVKAGIISTTFHFPDTPVNQVTGDVCDSQAQCPEYKVVAVKLSKA
jgi:formate dehydrogenase major subunit